MKVHTAAVAIGCVVTVTACGGAADADTNADLKIQAFVMCKQVVKAALKSPSTADFPFGDYTSTREGQTYHIKSYVDSQNGFGATVRTNYDCALRYKSGAATDIRNWDLVDMQLD